MTDHYRQLVHVNKEICVEKVFYSSTIVDHNQAIDLVGMVLKGLLKISAKNIIITYLL